MTHSPIFIMSFDRPDYLARVLDSLLSQVDCDLAHRTVVLFQDGAISPFTGKRSAAEATIKRCVRIFQEAFPTGIVKESSENLGVAFNFDRAEKFGFEEIGAAAAIFLEDDLVLGKHYISTVDKLVQRFAQDDRVGYVAAYGDHTKTLEEQHANRQHLVLLGHNWGFALFKRQWLNMRSRVLEYLEVIKGCDYKDRDGEKIKNLFASWGYGDPAISQDAAKTIACCVGGVVKINTYVCNASYIGERGLHMNEKIFAERGYSRTVVYPDAVSSFQNLDNDLYNKLLREQRGWAKSSRSPKKVSPDVKGNNNNSDRNLQLSAPPQKSTGIADGDPHSAPQRAEELVTGAYRALLRRDPDANGLAAYCCLFEGKPLVESMQRTISGIMKSAEFARKWQADNAPMPGPLLLCLQQAMLDNVASHLRGVTCARADGKVTLRFLFDGSIEDADRESVHAVAAHVTAEFTASETIVTEIVRVDYPTDRRSHGLAEWVYLRREKPATKSI